MYRFKRAFTLVELLVVIAIVALLMAIILPTLGRAREQAKSAKCLSGLKHMGTASAAYTTDNDGFLFPASWKAWSQPPASGPALDIIAVFSNYLSMPDWNSASSNRTNIWTCPSITIDINQKNQQWPLTYGANCMPHPKMTGDPTYVPAPTDFWHGRQIRAVSVPRPAEVISICDTAQLATGTSQGYIDGTSVSPGNPWWCSPPPSTEPNKPAYPPGTTNMLQANIDQVQGQPTITSRVRYRHHGNLDVNAVFVDGHAGSIRGPILGRNLSIIY